ncbi:MAG: glutathione peroxidase, partial [Bacilli bacterium]|nr:glutathione peroxidase [Bacilli bacterium]
MSIYNLKVKKRNNEEFDLSSLKGKVSLVVNTATGCGFTP